MWREMGADPIEEVLHRFPIVYRNESVNSHQTSRFEPYRGRLSSSPTRVARVGLNC